MPIYEYRCRKGHTFEVMQRMSDAPIDTCMQCTEPVERVFHPVAVHFKGSGFYTTDYGRNRGGGGDSAGGTGDSQKEKDTASTTSKDTAGAKSEGSSKSDNGS